LILPAILLALTAGCATAPATTSERSALVDESASSLRQMKLADASLAGFLGKSYGYVIFPNVGKGGFIAGGAYGRGTVYEKGQFVGYADLSQATVGLQAGGQSYSELIAFESQRDFDRFIGGRLTFAANLSAVALQSGAAASARYTDGVAVFVQPSGGLMLEAAVGGQTFHFMPK
jgi:lipid-binding SYLF domain-containing protein